MKLNKIFSKLSLIAIIALSGCTMINTVYSNYDKTVDFTKYKTYACLNSQKSQAQAPTPYYNDDVENNAKNYIDYHFKDRGYTVDTLKPDVLLEHVLKSEKKTEEVQTKNPYNYYNYSKHYSYNQSYSTKTRKYTQSAITINVIDRALNKMVWTRTAENEIYDPNILKRKSILR